MNVGRTSELLFGSAVTSEHAPAMPEDEVLGRPERAITDELKVYLPKLDQVPAGKDRPAEPFRHVVPLVPTEESKLRDLVQPLRASALHGRDRRAHIGLVVGGIQSKRQFSRADIEPPGACIGQVLALRRRELKPSKAMQFLLKLVQAQPRVVEFLLGRADRVDEFLLRLVLQLNDRDLQNVLGRQMVNGSARAAAPDQSLASRCEKVGEKVEASILVLRHDPEDVRHGELAELPTNVGHRPKVPPRRWSQKHPLLQEVLVVVLGTSS